MILHYPTRLMFLLLPLKTVIVICNLVFLTSALALPSSKSVAQYKIRSWQNQDGLPQNTVSSIAQTDDGYLWLGTLGGLTRFDGVDFSVFDSNNTPAIKHSMVVALTSDKDNTLWIGTSVGGLIRQQNGEFSHFGIAEGLPSEQVSSLFVSKTGVLWVGTDGAGLAVWNGQRFSTPSNSGKVGKHIRAFAESPAGIWIASERGLFFFDAKGQISEPLKDQDFHENNIRSLHFSTDGQLWVGQESGLRLINIVDKTIQVVHQLDKQSVMSILSDRDNNVWVATDGNGVVRIQRSSGPSASFKYQFQRILNQQAIQTLFEDSQGQLWAGSHLNGVTQISDTYLTPFSTTEGLHYPSIRSVYETTKGRLLIGTEGKGISLYSQGSFRPILAKFGLDERKIYSILEGAKGELYLGTDKGLYEIKDEKIAIYTTKDGLLSNTILSLHQDKAGELWIGSYSGGLNILIDGVIKTPDKALKIANNTVNVIAEDHLGAIWIGTRGAGLYQWKNKKLKHFTIEDGLADNLVFAIHEDFDGSLWIGTYGGGLSRYKNGILKTINEKHGLFDGVIHRIVDDGQGFFWMSTNKGIFKVNKTELADLANGKRHKIHSISYGLEDGMLNIECNGGANSGLMASDGFLWFPTVDGIVRINPQKHQEDDFQSNLIIESLSLDSQNMAKDEFQRLGPVINNLEIKYTIPHFNNVHAVAFRYRLFGSDNNWIYAGPRRTAYFSQLPAGTYTFVVQASLNGQEWTKAEKRLNFTVLPKFYQTLSFRAAFVFLALLVLYLIYRFRVNQFKKHNHRLELEVRARTQELEKVNQELQRLVTQDPLTGVLNRRAFDEILIQECRRCQRNDLPICLLLIDIDYFKQYNDSLGHQAGDQCIRNVAKILTGHFERASEFVARLGGDEFVVILSGVSLNQAISQAEKTCQATSQAHIPHPNSKVGKHVSVTIGVGCAVSPNEYKPNDLISKADKQLYRAKNCGRNQVSSCRS